MSYAPLVEPAADLSIDEVMRYSRHLIIPEVGMSGQKRLKAAKVLCVGAGGLGSPALMYLAAAGVGTLGIVEFDTVDESNLQRQIIHGQSDIGRSKAQSARESVNEINPYTEVVVHEVRLDVSNVMEIFAQYDLIVDGTDNFATRYLVNDACVLLDKPYVWGSIYRFDGRPVSSGRHMGLATAAFTLNHRPQGWFQVAQKAECLACSAAASVPSK
jgi:molybdopterin/thiamine biosynthesis adenylyltransferase